MKCINCLDIRTHLVDKTLSWARGNSVNAESRGVVL